MRHYEINGNLASIDYYDNFSRNIGLVMQIFIQVFGKEIMSRYDLYVDNGTKDTGYTPIITPILKKYLIIKLKISNFANSEQIVYQFAHELCHYVFYSILGINKKFADKSEENICSAMSLVLINQIFPDRLNFWLSHVKNLKDERYNGGASIAENVDFNLLLLKNVIIEKCNSEMLVEV